MAKYQVYKDVAGKFRFRLLADNGRIVVVSEAYEQHTGVLNGVESIKRNCTVGTEDLTIEGERITNPKYQVFTDAASEYRFRLIAPNGEIIGQSEGYETKASCLNGIEAMKESCDAEIEDMSVQPRPTPAAPVMQQAEPMIEEAKPKMEAESIMQQAAAETAMPSTIGEGETKIELEKLPETVTKGEILYFKGKLARGYTGIPKARIRIFEHDRSFLLDAAWADGYTKEDGTFDLTAKAKPPHFWNDTAKLYAEYDDYKEPKRIRSEVQTITIK